MPSLKLPRQGFAIGQLKARQKDKVVIESCFGCFQLPKRTAAILRFAGEIRRANELRTLMANGNVGLALVHVLCCKLFKYRKVHEWPPKVVKGEGWEDIYAAQSRGIDVLPNVDAAVIWGNELIARIANSELSER